MSNSTCVKAPWEAYNYAGQNPVMKVDPTGLAAVDDLSGKGQGWSTTMVDTFQWAGRWTNAVFDKVGSSGWCMFNPYKDCGREEDDDRGQGCPGNNMRFDENGVCVPIECGAGADCDDDYSPATYETCMRAARGSYEDWVDYCDYNHRGADNRTCRQVGGQSRTAKENW